MDAEVQPRLLTIPQAAQYLGAKVYTVRAAIWDGVLPYIRLGRRFCLDREDLDRFIDQNKRRECGAS